MARLTTRDEDEQATVPPRPLAERELWHELAQQLRVDAIRMVQEAGSGHPTSSMSAAELMAVLLAKHLRYDFDDPASPANDHLVFSKGHASPLYYAMLRAAGAIDDDEMLTYRKRGSRLEGHPAPTLPWIDVATGSLGQGLPIAVGMALAGRRLERAPFRVWVLCGDSEMAEGSIWEAFEHAAFAGLDNLTAIIDVNRLGQTGPTMLGWDLDTYALRARAFGWHPIVVDGHDVAAVDAAYDEALTIHDRPSVVIARTEKGHGVAEVADREGFHGKPLPHPDAAIAELGGKRDIRVHVEARPRARDQRGVGAGAPASAPALKAYARGSKEATRAAFGDALVALGEVRDDVVVLDGEVSNSTYSEKFRERFPKRFFEMYIAEQQLVAAAVGLQACHRRPFASTFAAFFTRAHDFIRMAAVSRADLVLCGSHAGVSIGEDGPSQMGLEDIAMMRSVFGSTVLYPCDANQAAALTVLLADHVGVSYLRTTREKTPVIYGGDDEFRIGGSTVLRSSGDDVATLVAAGVTVHECLRAADELAREGISVGIIDLYSVKPLDVGALEAAARRTKHIITVEDHFPEGGLGDAVLEALAGDDALPHITKLAVRCMPGSATPAEQLRDAGIDADAIAHAVRAIVIQGAPSAPVAPSAGASSESSDSSERHAGQEGRVR